MAPVALLPLVPLLALLWPDAQAAPVQEERYYGDAYGLSRPAALPVKRAQTLPAGWSYSGCVTESYGERLLQGFSFWSARNSPSFCIKECAKRGFKIAGTEWGSECYCANELSGAGGQKSSDRTCNVPCAGDWSSSCGAAWYLSLYTYDSGTDNKVDSCTAQLTVVPSVSATVSASVEASSSSVVASATSTSTSTSMSTTSSSSSATPSSSTTPSSSSTSTSASASTSAAPSTSSTSSASTTSDAATSTTSTAVTSTTPTPSPSATGGTVVGVSPDIPPSDDKHQVWAHHMVGNTYSYEQSDWAADIAAAAAQSIDGFALNVGFEGWQQDQVQKAYAAAEAQGSFKLFLSLDMTALPCSSPGHANNLVNLVKRHASSSAQAKYNGEVLISTFAGSSCTFGTGSSNGWQTAFVDPLTSSGLTISFIPSVFTNPNQFAQNTWMDGEFNWNSAWPMGNFDIDQNSNEHSYRTALGNKAYMTAVSPYFFTHFGANSWNKNWIYRSDNWLYCTRWEQIIAMRDVSSMTEILTWNDYGESSYIGPIKGNLPAGSDAWVRGFDHTGLAAITRYYATAFKTGAYPTPDKDEIILWARPHAAKATASNDHVGRPTGYDWAEDNLYAVVLATSPSTVSLTSGGTSMSFSVPAGLSKLKMPLAPGSISGTVQRNGQNVVSYDSGSQYSFTTTPTTYNYNYFVGASN